MQTPARENRAGVCFPGRLWPPFFFSGRGVGLAGFLEWVGHAKYVLMFAAAPMAARATATNHDRGATQALFNSGSFTPRMHLTSRELALLADVFKLLADRTLPEDVLRLEVGRRMLDLLRADHMGSYVWDGVQEKFGQRVALNMSADNLGDYERYFQYCDPLMPSLQNRREAVRVTDAIPHEALVRTEFFNDFLRLDGLYWGINLFVWDGDENIGDLRIWRGKHRENFSDHEVALLDLIRPAFTAALARARREAGMAKTADVSVEGIPAEMALTGADLLARLTRREREVVTLAAEGLLDKEIAQRLGISYTTVRTHLDRAFQKLGVNNRSRLARLLQLAQPR
ncbi:helix-turn-helix transcriptional regulator [Paraburkholderia sp. J63]|uniref:helix-turn-helix transcriptional regulator n=1 Tax=Paraburkholderia sp. J63 TaxID=2805434 RepID=UPI002ABDFE09|nr:helix-turn-helix transcriptional regulator [Paraburkholderia sp. J63]